MGPVLFTRTGLNVPFSSLMGSFAACLIAFTLTKGFITAGTRRRDRELELTANSRLREAGLSPNVWAAVQNSRALLSGEIEQFSQRQLAERAISAVPGIAGVTNHIHLRFTGRRLNADEIKRRMADSFLQHIELDAHGIQVRVQESSIVLEGSVPSSADADEAEELAWHIEGIEEVENRLKIAA
jgi:osmotically-inducible protein OsmY